MSDGKSPGGGIFTRLFGGGNTTLDDDARDTLLAFGQELGPNDESSQAPRRAWNGGANGNPARNGKVAAGEDDEAFGFRGRASTDMPRSRAANRPLKYGGRHARRDLYHKLNISPSSSSTRRIITLDMITANKKCSIDWLAFFQFIFCHLPCISDKVAALDPQTPVRISFFCCFFTKAFKRF